MKTIAIGGEILCNEKIDGIHRYMLEILRRVDKRLEGSDMKIVVYIRKGETIKHIRFSNIAVDEVDAPSSLFHFRFVPKYVKRLGAIDCNMSNNVTVCKGSIATICDLIPLSKLSGFSFKNKCKFRILYKLVSRYAGTVVTLTQHIGDSLVEKIKTDPKKIVISGCGWDHMKDIDEDEKIFERYPEIKKGQYYYAMGNQFPYKNFAWVTNNALRNPGCMYVIAGNVPPGFKSPEKFPNVIYVGYISDGEHKALLKNAKAFIHPDWRALAYRRWKHSALVCRRWLRMRHAFRRCMGIMFIISIPMMPMWIWKN